MDPRLRAVYLVAVAVGVFFLRDPAAVGAVAAAQAVLFVAVGLGARALVRQLRKLALFLGVIFVAYALVGTGEAGQTWRTVAGLRWSVPGAALGLGMVLRIAAVVLASQVARAGDPRALAAGLGKLGVPRMAALAIDTTLALLGDGGGRGQGRGAGRGQGRGGGRGQGHGGGDAAGAPPPESTDAPARGIGARVRDFWAALGRLGRGDMTRLVSRIDAQIDRAADYIVAHTGEADRGRARDVAVIAGMALTMLSVKVLKLLPGLPFAPGHKGVVLIPLYFVAARLTRARFGATWTGLTMGAVAFLMGDGRYGVFEIFKHVAPGLLADVLVPVVPRNAGRAAWAAVGAVTALGRFATVTAIALCVQPPAVVYALLVPGLIVHGTFGVLSSIVTAPLLRAIDARSSTRGNPRCAPDCHDTPTDNRDETDSTEAA
ncbi:MAG: hypothetical protein D6689_13650 [Deltaproteobacteria bacterium]|nr:MAG: hypothetical protein D6689_13650 [Deltaproteobacteria bacterium]